MTAASTASSGVGPDQDRLRLQVVKQRVRLEHSAAGQAEDIEESITTTTPMVTRARRQAIERRRRREPDGHERAEQQHVQPQSGRLRMASHR